MSNTTEKTPSISTGIHSIHNQSLNGYEPSQYEMYENNSIKSNSFENNLEYAPEIQEIISNSNSSDYPNSLRFLLPIYSSCSKCNNNYTFDVEGSDYMTIECECNLIRNIRLSEFIKHFCSKTLGYYGCKKDMKKNIIKKYIYYCKDCKKDLCEECVKEISPFINNGGKRKVHETHELIDLLNIEKEIEEINILTNVNNGESDNKMILKNLLINLAKYYKENPNYSAYKVIKNYKQIFDKSSKPIEKPILKYEELIKINSLKSLKDNIDSSNKIYKIEIDSKETKDIMEDLNIFKDKNFDELKKMHLSNIKLLKDITALSTCSFQRLKKLIIENSELGDSCINVIKNIHPEIKHCLKKILIFKNEYIYYINKEKIIVGIFRYSALFIPSYVFIYKSLELEKEEAKIMLSLNINEYLKKRNCDVQSENQILKNENGEEIGSFIKQSQKNKKTVKKNFPSERNSKIINNENLINKTSNNNKDFNTIEAKQKKKKSELINYFKFN